MIKPFALAFAAVLASSAAFASQPVALTDANTDQIRALLTGQGYEVGKIKLEDGLYEAYARKDGERYEVFMNGDFEIVRTERD